MIFDFCRVIMTGFAILISLLKVKCRCHEQKKDTGTALHMFPIFDFVMCIGLISIYDQCYGCVGRIVNNYSHWALLPY